MDKTKIFAAAEKAVLKGQIPKAIEHLEQIVGKDAKDAKALNKLADLYLKQSDKGRAVELLKRVGEIYHRDGFYSKAAAIYKRILKIEEGAPKEDLIEVHERLAELYQQLDLASEAMPHFKIVVDYYDDTENRESLLRVLKNISELDPGNLDSQLKLAELFVNQGKPDEADDTLLRLEEAVISERSLADVARFYDKWLELFPERIDLLKKLVETYLNGGEPKRALGVLQRAFRADPYNVDVLELLSESFRRLSQEDKARAVDMELVKIYRKSENTEKLSEVEQRIKGDPPSTGKTTTRHMARQMQDAIDPADQLLSKETQAPEEVKILSECEVYLKYGLVDKAREVLSDQLQHHPKSLGLRWKLKNVYVELRDTEAARQVLSELSLLAKERNEEEWLRLASEELAQLGSSMSPTKEVSLESQGSAEALKAEEGPSSDTMEHRVSSFAEVEEDSDLSIVVEDDLVLEGSATSGAPAGEAKVREEPPAVVEDSHEDLEELEALELSDEIELLPEGDDLEKSEPQDEAGVVAGPAEPDQTPPEAQTVASDSSSEEPADELVDGEFLLSESDFSSEELQELGQQLGGEDAVEALDEPTEQPMDLDQANQDATEAVEVSKDSHEEVVGDRDFEIKQGLEEIAFFKAQGLNQEADDLLKSLQKKYPDHTNWDLPAVSGEIPFGAEAGARESESLGQEVELEALGTKMKMRVQEDQREDDDFFDFAAELQEELGDDGDTSSDVPVEVKDVFGAFKEGVAKSVSDDDVDTHFDLAVAYREMGLLDDAYSSFELCSKSAGRKTEALYQMGLIHMLREDFESARKVFHEALSQPQLEDQQRLSLSYELGEISLALEDHQGARKHFEEVQNMDPEFREVQDRLSRLASA